MARVIRRLPEWSGSDDAVLRQLIKRRHCLSVLAQELGFRGWPDAVAVLGGATANAPGMANKFVVGHGRIVSQDRVSRSACDAALTSAAREALSHLRHGEAIFLIRLPDATELAVGLGTSRSELPQEMLARLSAAAQEQLARGRDARERRQNATIFHLKVADTVEHYFLAARASADLLLLVGMYGAIAGTFVHGELRKSEQERDLSVTPERMQQFKEIAARIVGSAPAFMCSGRLSGVAARFADCVAMEMLFADA
jgi:hypothetical protein